MDQKISSWGGLTCSLSAAALHLLSRHSGRDAKIVRSVTKVNQLKDLAQLLDTTDRKVLPLVVTISGQVGSDTPIACKHDGLRGVIVEETAEHCFLKYKGVGSWVQDSTAKLSMSKEVPWYLDDGTGRVYVVGARRATGLVLTLASGFFEEYGVGHSFLRGILDYLQGLKMLGVKRTERVLPTGTSLTVVGKAVKDWTGTIRIEQPQEGPFYVTPKSIDQLIAILGKRARLYDYASLAFTILGVCLFLKQATEYITERIRSWDLQKRVRAAAIAIAAVAQRLKKDHEAAAVQRFKKNREAAAAQRLKKDSEDASMGDDIFPDHCVICWENERNQVFVPCGHILCCATCSTGLTVCLLCQCYIKEIVKTYRS